MVDCNDVTQLLPDFLYDELDSDQRRRVEEHLSTCSRCTEEVVGLRNTMHALDGWRAVEGRDDFREWIVKAQEGSRRLSRRRSGFAGLLLPTAVGAVAALLFFSVLTWVGTTVERRGETLAISYGREAADAISLPSNEDGSQYLLLLHEDARSMVADDSQEQSRLVSEYAAWATRLGAQGMLIAGEKLVNADGRFVRIEDGSAVVTAARRRHEDDSITGFFHIRADSWEQALALTRGCPHLKYGNTIELREIDKRRR
jgi:hypothetical protein